MAKIKIEDLPPFVKAPCCGNFHYLTLNRCIDGTWSIGYLDFESNDAVQGLALNNSSTVDEALLRMDYAIKRFEKRKAQP